jgi:3D (Asp-Asp-Asp) domain-containing protein
MNGRIANSTRLSRRFFRAAIQSANFRTWLLVVACAMSMALLGAVRSQGPAVPLMALSEPNPAEWNEKSDGPTLGALESADEPTLVSAALPAPGGIPAEAELLRDNTPGAPALASPAPVAPAPLLALPRPTLGGPKLRTMLMEVTAYCPCVRCCGSRAQGLTASGRHVSFNGGRFVAADTKLLKFNTKLRIPGYADESPVQVIDRGGAIKGAKLDVFFPTHEEARRWGRQKLLVTVIDE